MLCVPGPPDFLTMNDFRFLPSAVPNRAAILQRHLCFDVPRPSVSTGESFRATVRKIIFVLFYLPCRFSGMLPVDASLLNVPVRTARCVVLFVP